jgi:3-oxoacyl-[acyl-carrier protein] reductase
VQPSVSVDGASGRLRVVQVAEHQVRAAEQNLAGPVLGWRAQPGQAHYAAAKAGVMAFTRCAALDVAGHGIRVNAVAPSRR